MQNINDGMNDDLFLQEVKKYDEQLKRSLNVAPIEKWRLVASIPIDDVVHINVLDQEHVLIRPTENNSSCFIYNITNRAKQELHYQDLVTVAKQYLKV
jgi:hypothetical protein